MKNQTILDRLRSFIAVNGGNANGLKTIEDAVKRLNSIPGGGGGLNVMPFPWDDRTEYIEKSAVDALVANLPDVFEYDVTQYGATNKLRLFFALTVNRGAGLGYNFGSFVSAASNYGIAIYPEYAIQYGDMSGTPNVFNYNASTNRYERQS